MTLKPSKDETYRPPLSVSKSDLLDNGADDRFREVIYALFVTATRFQDIREAFGREMNVSGAQYFVLMAIASHQAQGGIGIRALADYLHVAASHATVEVNKLVTRGLLAKQAHPEDGRRVVITLSPAGKQALEQLAPFRQQINDLLFDGFDREDLGEMVRIFDRFVNNTARAQLAVAAHEQFKTQTVAAE
jgi:DNA-binding MarR family transcriptional regulator